MESESDGSWAPGSRAAPSTSAPVGSSRGAAVPAARTPLAGHGPVSDPGGNWATIVASATATSVAATSIISATVVVVPSSVASEAASDTTAAAPTIVLEGRHRHAFAARPGSQRRFTFPPVAAAAEV